MKSKLSAVGVKLYEQLQKLWDHEDFILGVLSFSDNDEDRQVVLDYIQKGKDVTTDSINLLSLELNINRYGEFDCRED